VHCFAHLSVKLAGTEVGNITFQIHRADTSPLNRGNDQRSHGILFHLSR